MSKPVLVVTCGFDGGKSGISVYMREVLMRLALSRRVVAVACAGDRAELPEHENIEYHVLPRWMNRAVFNMLYVALIFPWCFRPSKYDFLLLPAVNRRSPVWKRFFTVGVVHDLSQFHVDHKYDALRMFYVCKLLPFAARRMDRLVAVSESTKIDMVRFWKVKPELVTVNYNGFDHESFRAEMPPSASSVLQRYGIDGEYLLYISRLEHPGKNHVRLIEAYEMLPEALKQRYLLVLGGSAWNGSEAIIQRAERSPDAKRIRLIGFVDQADLPGLYHQAAVYVFPSLFEGFGLSVPEAMACGTPVCCSRNSSLGEIAGDAAELFDPENARDIARGIGRILEDPVRREELRRLGLERARLFDWDRHVEVLLGLGEERYRRKLSLMGVDFDNVSMDQALELIDTALQKKQRIKVGFVNADCFNKAYKNKVYRKQLAAFDYVFPDGSGVALAEKLRRETVRDNVNGTDLFPLLVELSRKRGYRIYLLGAAPGVAERVVHRQTVTRPDLKMVGWRDGFHLDGAVADINRSGADLLLVGMGVPLQEQWITEHFAELNCGAALGVGGLFDFYSGRIPRAPLWWRRLGMEWSFRLMMEPRRMFRRYIIGNPLFLVRSLLTWRVRGNYDE